MMFDTAVGTGAVLDHAIVDKDCRIGDGARIGHGTDLRPNREEPERLYAGLTQLPDRSRGAAA